MRADRFNLQSVNSMGEMLFSLIRRQMAQSNERKPIIGNSGWRAYLYRRFTFLKYLITYILNTNSAD